MPNGHTEECRHWQNGFVAAAQQTHFLLQGMGNDLRWNADSDIIEDFLIY